MRFASGMLGVCISVLAIVGMVLAGSVLSVSEYERTTTGYDYVTDITGLFEASDQPAYIDYNPARNWTGFYTTDYDVTDGIAFEVTPDNRANAYPIGQERGELRAATEDLVGMDLPQQSPPTAEQQQGNRWAVKIDSDDTIGPYVGSDEIDRPYVASLKDFIEAVEGSDDADILTLDISPGSSTYGIILVNPSDWVHTEQVTSVGGVTRWQLYTLNYYPDQQAYDRAEIVLESGVVRLYKGDTVTSSTVTALQVIYGSSQYTEGELAESVDITLFEEPPATYLDSSRGVALDAQTVQWSNGYTTSAMDVLIRIPDVGTSYGMEMVLDVGGDGLTVKVSADTSGNVSIVLGDHATTIGKWSNFVLSLDTMDGIYRAIPVTDFVSFTPGQYTVMDGAAYTLSSDVSGKTFDSMTLTTSSNSFRFGIVQTEVFLETYDVVMVDPSLDPGLYFTDLADMRINFYSFALYGSEISINGEDYAVNDAAQIMVPVPDGEGGTIDTWTTLTNIYITFQEDRTYLTFVNDDLTIDLGETETTLISFTGVWYFSAAIWEGYETTETVTDWNPGDFFFDGNGAIIAFLGFLALGTIIGARIVRGSMEALDYIVVAFAGLCGLVLLVV